MKRFTATITDATDPKVDIDTFADDAGELIRKIQGHVMDSYGRQLTAVKSLTVQIIDDRDPDHALMVAAPSKEQLLEEVDKAIRNTYRTELQPNGGA